MLFSKARAVDCPVPLMSYALLPRLDECLSPHAFICLSNLGVKLVRFNHELTAMDANRAEGKRPRNETDETDTLERRCGGRRIRERTIPCDRELASASRREQRTLKLLHVDGYAASP